jgi:hypothetical protein
MVDHKWGNQWQALVACSLFVVACENPGREIDDIEGSGAAGSAAVRSTADRARGADVSVADEQNELADAAVRRSAQSGRGSCGAAAVARDGACEGRLSGLYGVEVTVDVRWSDEINPIVPAFDPGRGKVTALLLAELDGLCPGENEGDLATRVCDLSLPPLYSNVTGGIAQLTVPHATWERSSIPEVTARVRSTGRENPGFEIVSPMIALLGIELESREAAWPTHRDTALVTCADRRSGADCFPDQDEDDHPGITLRTVLSGAVPSAAPDRKGGWRYTPVPTDVSLPLAGTGATALFVGLRTKLGGAYAVGSDCNGSAGTATAGDFELRVFDCAMLDGAPCSVGSATVVDRNMPVFHAIGATNRLIRLSDTSTCSDVRQAFASTTARMW